VAPAMSPGSKTPKPGKPSPSNQVNGPPQSSSPGRTTVFAAAPFPRHGPQAQPITSITGNSHTSHSGSRSRHFPRPFLATGNRVPIDPMGFHRPQSKRFLDVIASRLFKGGLLGLRAMKEEFMDNDGTVAAGAASAVDHPAFPFFERQGSFRCEVGTVFVLGAGWLLNRIAFQNPGSSPTGRPPSPKLRGRFLPLPWLCGPSSIVDRSLQQLQRARPAVP